MRILLVDDHPVMRLGLRVLLQEMDGAEVVGEAASSKEALRQAEELRPELVVLEPALEDGDGELGVCRALKSLEEPPRVLIYSARGSREDLAKASLAGADSYLSKRCGGEQLLEAVERTCGGQRFWLLDLEKDGPEARFVTKVQSSNLTQREMEILARLLTRRTNEEIAEELHLSGNTVKTHVRNILKELRFNNRQELYRNGLS